MNFITHTGRDPVKKDKTKITTYISAVAVGLIIVGSIIAYIYCLVVYGDKPLSEVPYWALQFLK